VWLKIRANWSQGWRALVFGEGLRLGLRLSQFFSGSQALGLRLRLSPKKHYVLNATLSTHESYLYSKRVRKSATKELENPKMKKENGTKRRPTLVMVRRHLIFKKKLSPPHPPGVSITLF
jgi:hypothetical protein